MLKKRNILLLFNALQQVTDLKGVKFSYAVAKNIRLIMPEIEALEKSLEMDEEMKQFEKLRIEIAEKYASKDEKGLSIKNNELYEFSDENRSLAEQEFEKLKAEKMEVFLRRDKQVREYNELLDTESSVILHKIKLGDVPENITPIQMNQIIDIIEEE